MKKNWFTTGLTAVLCAVMLITGASAVSIGGGTTTTDVNFRTGASTSSSIIATLPAGTTVVVTDGGGGWYKVVYNGTEGYLSGDYVTFTKNMSGSFGTGVRRSVPISGLFSAFQVRPPEPSVCTCSASHCCAVSAPFF